MKTEYPIPVKKIFSELHEKTEAELYLVGGSVRDLLFGKEVNDLDFATAAAPSFVHSLFPDALYFPKYGTVSFRIPPYFVTLASMRREETYLDHRHPLTVTFLSDYRIDALRRDFTLNALYGDEKGNILDPTGQGLSDLKRHILRMVGEPMARLTEDPLRILRAYRFMEELSLNLEPTLEEALAEKKELVFLLNPEKVREEIGKFPESVRQHYRELFLR